MTIEEDNRLRLFLSLLAFRSVNTRDQFRNGISEASKKIYAENQENFNFEKMWLNNVLQISKYRDI